MICFWHWFETFHSDTSFPPPYVPSHTTALGLIDVSGPVDSPPGNGTYALLGSVCAGAAELGTSLYLAQRLPPPQAKRPGPHPFPLPTHACALPVAAHPPRCCRVRAALAAAPPRGSTSRAPAGAPPPSSTSSGGRRRTITASSGAPRSPQLWLDSTLPSMQSLSHCQTPHLTDFF